ncbi:MAG: metal-dependent hydrolase [Thermoplasmata archaeon]|nr:metal-dependent hydrolase [Thermoplasmata archaeon]
MDLFTHVLTAYLLTFGLVGFQPSYLIAGAIAGGLPDADILVFPLARRFPILRHHGITHSIFGVTVFAAIGGLWVAPMLAHGGNPLVFFGVMMAGGLAHMLEDGFTHYSVAPLLPFSEKPLEVDADRAINFVTLVVSVVSFYVLLGVERGHVAFEVYLLSVYALMVFFVAYFVVRGAARLAVERRKKTVGDFDVAVPTTNPLVWLLLRESKTGGRMRTSFARYVFGRGVTRGPFSVDVPMDAPGTSGPAVDASDALARTYGLARKESGVLDDTYSFGEATAVGEGKWRVHWYSLEFSAFGRAAGVRVDLAADGTAHTKSAWHVPLWRRELT